MSARLSARSEATRRAIADAARQLFAERGYDDVSMREIAKAAGCSHTTIYIYFEDKEALLHELATGPLQQLDESLRRIAGDARLDAAARLRQMSEAYIAFGLRNGSIYHLLFTARPNRVDDPAPVLDVQRQRLALFDVLQAAVAACQPPSVNASPERTLALARSHFYMLHGIVTTYASSIETADAVLARLGETFAVAIDTLIAGYERETGGMANES